MTGEIEKTSHLVYLGLGANLGRRAENLRAALRLSAARGLCFKAVSFFYETEPVGGPPGQGKYLNAAAAANTAAAPEQLLEILKAVERELGRDHGTGVRWGPRPVDLDLLFYDDLVINDPPKLIVPHPRLAERGFVLTPLAEIAPEVRHPVLGRTARELSAAARRAGLFSPDDVRRTTESTG